VFSSPRIFILDIGMLPRSGVFLYLPSMMRCWLRTGSSAFASTTHYGYWETSPSLPRQLIAELPGTKHLIAGNHDRCHPMHRDAHNWQRRYLEVFDSVQSFARRRIAGRQVMLSHFPFSGDHTFEDRYTQYRLRDEGAWLLHGHTHSMSKGEGRQIHVGADAWGMAPVSLEVIEKMVWTTAH